MREFRDDVARWWRNVIKPLLIALAHLPCALLHPDRIEIDLSHLTQDKDKR